MELYTSPEPADTPDHVQMDSRDENGGDALWHCLFWSSLNNYIDRRPDAVFHLPTTSRPIVQALNDLCDFSTAIEFYVE
jgi:hypothetical protein